MNTMKTMTLSAVLLAFCFATGFTCSKNAPQATEPTQTAPADQATMAAPADATAPAPTQEGTAAPVEGAPATAPTAAGTQAAPTTTTK